MAPVTCIAVSETPLQAFVDRPRTQDQQVVTRLQPVRDRRHESLQVLEAVRLAGGLRAATSAVADGRVMPNVAGRPVVGRHL